jgi:hypothetical protein
MFERRRFKQSAPLEDRLTAFAQGIERDGGSPGWSERDEMLRKAKKALAAK